MIGWRGPLPVPRTPPAPPRVPGWKRVLGPVYRAWMRFARLLAWINTRVLLAIIFFLVVTPIRAGLWLARRDPMKRKRDPEKASYWIERTPAERERPPTDYERTF